MSRWFLALIVSCSICSILAAQNRSVLKGVVLDEVTGEVIPFAHVVFDGTVHGSSTNLDGHFELKIPDFLNHIAIKVSCIGYESTSIELTNIPSARKPILLKPTTTTLQGVVVAASTPRMKEKDKARKLVRRAIRKIPRNYANDPARLPAFYRHYCAENGQYVRLIEAAVDLTRSGKDPYHTTIPQENLGFDVTQLRRSFDYTQNARLSHPPISLNYLLTGDLTSCEYSNPLDIKSAQYRMLDTTSFEGKKVYVIGMYATAASKKTSFQGKLYLEAESLAFLRIEFNEWSGRKTISDSTDVQLKRITFFKKRQNQYYLDRSSTDVRALKLAYDTLGQTIDSIVHTSHIELITNNILDNPDKLKGGTEPTAEELAHVDYDSTFWDNYNILEATAIEEEIIADLSKKINLRKQFALFNTIEEGGKSIIKSKAFQQVLEKYRDFPTYVVIWSGQSHPNHFEVAPHRWLARKLKREKARLLMISIEENEQQWTMAREAYQLNIPGVIHERIDFDFDSELIADLFSDVLPFYCFFNKAGELISSAPPMPAHEDIQLLLAPKSIR